MPSPHVLPSQIGSSMTTVLGIGGNPKSGAAGAPPRGYAGRGWPLVIHPSPHRLPNLVAPSRDVSVIMEIRLKILTPRVQPFKVTQDHWNQHGSVDYLWLAIRDVVLETAVLVSRALETDFSRSWSWSWYLRSWSRRVGLEYFSRPTVPTGHAWVTLYSVTWCLLNAILSCKLDVNQCLWSFW